MPVVTDETIINGSSERITSFRSSTNRGGEKVKNTCDYKISFLDPFDFRVEYKSRFVTVRVYYTLKGRTRYKLVKKLVPYPYYYFKMKTRTVKQWRLELAAGKKVMKYSPIELQQVSKRVKSLERKLAKYGQCFPKPPRSAHRQNDCLHWKTTISGFGGDQYLPRPIGTNPVPLISNFHYQHRAYELNHEEFAGTQTMNGDCTAFSVLMQAKTIDEPLLYIKDPARISLITAMLWPSSDDYANRDASPLVDLSEAAADGVFPLGPPPDAIEAHERMVRSTLDDNHIKALKQGIDFAANSWLWTTLVLEPVISSAVGLSASVQANDDAIEAYQKSIKKGNWFQGNSVRIFGRDPKESAECFGAPTEHIETYGTDECGSGYYGTLTHSIEYRKFTANAMMAYKPSFAAAAGMNTSGQRLSSFFNRLSTDLDKVLYNLVPLSFVTDWFTSEYSGKLNLKDKVYMPIDDWKIIVSFHNQVLMNSKINQSTYGSIVKREYICSQLTSCTHPWAFGPFDNPKYYYKTNNYEVQSCFPVGEWSTCGRTIFCAVGKERVTENTNLSYDFVFDIQEDHEYYDRRVYSKPPKATSYDMSLIECKDDKNVDLSEGQQVTLGALIWGFADRFAG